MTPKQIKNAHELFLKLERLESLMKELHPATAEGPVRLTGGLYRGDRHVVDLNILASSYGLDAHTIYEAARHATIEELYKLMAEIKKELAGLGVNFTEETSNGGKS